MSSNGTPPDPAAMKMRFFRYFQHEVTGINILFRYKETYTKLITALQEQMERLSNTALAGGERNDAVEHCLAGIARLSQEVKDASSYVPTYDQKTYSEVCSSYPKPPWKHSPASSSAFPIIEHFYTSSLAYHASSDSTI